MDAASAISAHDLRKTFRNSTGTVHALAGVDLEIPAGETFGLIGPDGAGKSTLTRLLLGLLHRTGGECRVLGHDPEHDPYAVRERAGYIAQRFVLPADMTVLENLRFFGKVHCVSRADLGSRIPRLLAFAGLEEFTDRPAGRLSGGMKKKLALACSLIHSPELVLLDEPTLGVDPVSRREFWSLLGDLRASQGLTIFVCTPYMDEAERCHRVGLIHGGRLIACDTPAAIKALVPGQLLEFKPSAFMPAYRLFEELPGVLEVQTYGNMLHVFVDDAAARRDSLEAALAAQGITVQGMRQIEPRMEEAFISLIARARSKA